MNTELGSSLFVGGLINFVIRTAVIVLFVWMITKFIDKGLDQVSRSKKTNNMLLVYLRKILNAIVFVIALFSILSSIIPFSGLGSAVLGATSVLTVVVGLAAQETFGNFIAGFFLAIGQPFAVGDLATLPEKNITGTVKEITFRHTVLQTIENTEMIIPNSLMNSAVLENKVFGQGVFTRFIKISVAYDSDIKLVKKLIYEAENNHPLIVKQGNPQDAEPFDIRVSDFLDSGIEITFPVSTKDMKDNLNASSDIREQLLITFKENNIEIPYPHVQILK